MALRLTVLIAALALPALAAEPEPRTVIFDVAKGGVLGGLATAATAWVWSRVRRRTQIEPDPLNVRGVPQSVKEPTCEAKHQAIEAWREENRDSHKNLFDRMSEAEARLGVLEGALGEIRGAYRSIDDKLTALMRRK